MCYGGAERLLVQAVVWDLARGLQQWLMGQGQSVNFAMHTFVVGPWLPKRQHYHFLRSNTQTEPSDALAPTLSPVEFQHTSKMPPVPL